MSIFRFGSSLKNTNGLSSITVKELFWGNFFVITSSVYSIVIIKPDGLYTHLSAAEVLCCRFELIFEKWKSSYRKISCARDLEGGWLGFQ